MPPAPIAAHEVPASVEPPTLESPPRVESAAEPSGELPPAEAPSGEGASAPMAGPPPGEHPLAATNSPWTQTADGTAPPVPLPSADVLPSAQVAAASEPKEEPVIAPVSEDSGSSRTLMTVGLAIAAVALIALVAYFMTTSGDVSDDPTSVGGVEQRDYGDDPAPKPSASATAKPAPRPYVPPPATKPPAGDIYDTVEPKPATPSEDIYDDL